MPARTLLLLRRRLWRRRLTGLANTQACLPRARNAQLAAVVVPRHALVHGHHHAVRAELVQPQQAVVAAELRQQEGRVLLGQDVVVHALVHRHGGHRVARLLHARVALRAQVCLEGGQEAHRLLVHVLAHDPLEYPELEAVHGSQQRQHHAAQVGADDVARQLGVPQLVVQHPVAGDGQAGEQGGSVGGLIQGSACHVLLVQPLKLALNLLKDCLLPPLDVLHRPSLGDVVQLLVQGGKPVFLHSCRVVL
mmetsp:Transcript_3054/g.7641  ORF Transcript_3054/g.7641 Transcript_3054/m.7641 type:complete len:250 (-) Transcript_3054:504-1253(-)